MERLRIEKLGPLGNVDVEFGDLTIIVGPQASGKSVFLETLKLADDREFIVSTLERYGFILGHKPKKILDAYFGQGCRRCGLTKRGSQLTTGSFFSIP